MFVNNCIYCLFAKIVAYRAVRIDADTSNVYKSNTFIIVYFVQVLIYLCG